MHFNRKELITAVMAASKLVGKRMARPILGCVKLELLDHGAGLSATDLDTWLMLTLGSGATGTITPVCLEVKQFLQVLKSKKDDLVLISTIGEETFVDSMRVESYPAAGYPTVPELAFKSGDFAIASASDMQRITDQVAWAARDYEHNSVLGAISLAGIEAVATDGSRFSQIDLPDMVGNRSTSLVPANVWNKVIAPLVKTSIKNMNSIKLMSTTMSDAAAVAFQSGSWTVVTRTMPGEYPRYKELIPAQSGSFVTYEKAEVLEKLKQLKPFLDKGTNVIDIDPEHVSMSVGDHQVTIAAGISPQLSATLDRDCIRWSCNYHYFVQAIESVPSDYVDIQYAGPCKPLVFFASDYRHLLMPVQTKDKKGRYESDCEAKVAALKDLETA